MNGRKSLSWLMVLVASGIGGVSTDLVAAPIGTAFTYQGRFTDNGSPANGTYDFEFSLYDAAMAGVQVGSAVAKEDMSVTDGYFTTTLDFGSGIFAGDSRWLQIAVRPGGSTGAYTTLTPRHELTATPYALCTKGVTIPDGGTIGAGHAKILFNDTADRLDLGDSATAVSVALLGTVTPLILDTYGTYRDIHVSQNGGGIRIYAADTLTATPNGASLQFFANGESNFGGKAFIDSGATNNAAIILRTAPTGQQITERMRITSDGNVGVGTTTPSEKLDVSGTVRCVSLVQTSDEQLKTDVQPLSGVLGKLDQVQAVSFRWNEKARSLGIAADTRQIGVLAQELEQAFPELVTTPKPSTAHELIRTCPEHVLTAAVKQRSQEDAEKTGYKAVNYSQLTVVLLEAVKELQAENRTLTQRIQAMESKAQ